MIHMFYMNLSGGCSYEQSLALYEILPENRKAGVKKALNASVAKKRLYTGAFLQYVLSRETGISMDKICYRYGEQGKPELDYPEILGKTESGKAKKVPVVYFNLSHSGEYAVLAVSDRPVGIDIEHKKKNYLAVAKRCFCENEYTDIISAGEREEQEKCFLVYWTMKEAFIKHSGEGLRIPLNSFRILREESGTACVEGLDRWFAVCFMEDADYCVSVCSDSLPDVETVLRVGGRMTRLEMDELCTQIKEL